MRHAVALDVVGYCQVCEEPLTSRDIIATGQAKVCPECFEANHLPWQVFDRAAWVDGKDRR